MIIFVLHISEDIPRKVLISKMSTTVKEKVKNSNNIQTTRSGSK